eukprot:gnl/Dysnectes_brevis/485_a538_3434.p1 GENE.gnl/Dysnectes_brevis/485_a538_3434~~gnl/Dysnectes_brevis/485_a538_3434.p1  ORF type:complete len:989 (+),score=461.61 gnl/Dysnectes_brevis/485_a538_3434:46-3012(+)
MDFQTLITAPVYSGVPSQFKVLDPRLWSVTASKAAESDSSVNNLTDGKITTAAVFTGSVTLTINFNMLISTPQDTAGICLYLTGKSTPTMVEMTVMGKTPVAFRPFMIKPTQGFHLLSFPFHTAFSSNTVKLVFRAVTDSETFEVALLQPLKARQPLEKSLQAAVKHYLTRVRFPLATPTQSVKPKRTPFDVIPPDATLVYQSPYGKVSLPVHGFLIRKRLPQIKHTEGSEEIDGSEVFSPLSAIHPYMPLHLLYLIYTDDPEPISRFLLLDKPPLHLLNGEVSTVLHLPPSHPLEKSGSGSALTGVLASMPAYLTLSAPLNLEELANRAFSQLSVIDSTAEKAIDAFIADNIMTASEERPLPLEVHVHPADPSLLIIETEQLGRAYFAYRAEHVVEDTDFDTVHAWNTRQLQRAYTTGGMSVLSRRGIISKQEQGFLPPQLKQMYLQIPAASLLRDFPITPRSLMGVCTLMHAGQVSGSKSVQDAAERLAMTLLGSGVQALLFLPVVECFETPIVSAQVFNGLITGDMITAELLSNMSPRLLKEYAIYSHNQFVRDVLKKKAGAKKDAADSKLLEAGAAVTLSATPHKCSIIALKDQHMAVDDEADVLADALAAVSSLNATTPAAGTSAPVRASKGGMADLSAFGFGAPVAPVSTAAPMSTALAPSFGWQGLPAYTRVTGYCVFYDSKSDLGVACFGSESPEFVFRRKDVHVCALNEDAATARSTDARVRGGSLETLLSQLERERHSMLWKQVGGDGPHLPTDEQPITFTIKPFPPRPTDQEKLHPPAPRPLASAPFVVLETGERTEQISRDQRFEPSAVNIAIHQHFEEKPAEVDEEEADLDKGSIPSLADLAILLGMDTPLVARPSIVPLRPLEGCIKPGALPVHSGLMQARYIPPPRLAESEAALWEYAQLAPPAVAQGPSGVPLVVHEEDFEEEEREPVFKVPVQPIVPRRYKHGEPTPSFSNDTALCIWLGEHPTHDSWDGE